METKPNDVGEWVYENSHKNQNKRANLFMRLLWQWTGPIDHMCCDIVSKQIQKEKVLSLSLPLSTSKLNKQF